MQTIQLRGGLALPPIAIGCMRLLNRDEQQNRALIELALERGFCFFDHADIYGGGECERRFAAAYGMTADRREKIILQSKCGIRGGFFDFSPEHILSAVEGSLRRLRTDYLDLLLLHRPDALAEPEQVAEAFDLLSRRGMVRHFGVSNHTPGQIRLLQKAGVKVEVNQMQFGLGHTGMIDSGLHANMRDPAATDFDGGVLDFCRLEGITVQAWSPFLYGYFEGNIFRAEKYAPLREALEACARDHAVSPAAVAVAWILRHPAKIQPITGTADPLHLAQCLDGADISLSREEWYRLYTAAGNTLP